MKTYKYAITLNNKTIARNQTKEVITKRYNEICNYLNDNSITFKTIKGNAEDLKVIEL